jgi:hypothetical protein
LLKLFVYEMNVTDRKVNELRLLTVSLGHPVNALRTSLRSILQHMRLYYDVSGHGQVMNQNVKGEFSQTGKSQQIVLLYIKP